MSICPYSDLAVRFSVSLVGQSEGLRGPMFSGRLPADEDDFDKS